MAEFAAPDSGRPAGKVVLVDFWTYTCINWLRTLPYIRAWASKYKDHGLVVIGVHTPEFGFEKYSRTFAGPSRKCGSSIQLRLTTTTRSGARSGTNMAGPLLHRFARTHSPTPFRRRGVRAVGADDSTAADGRGAGGPRDGLVSVDAAASRWRRTGTTGSPENYLGYARTANFASPGGVKRIGFLLMPRPPLLGPNDGRSPATGRSAERRRS